MFTAQYELTLQIQFQSILVFKELMSIFKMYTLRGSNIITVMDNALCRALKEQTVVYISIILRRINNTHINHQSGTLFCQSKTENVTAPPPSRDAEDLTGTFDFLLVLTYVNEAPATIQKININLN